jgi:putative PIN family toxin of toxin-antitoxin system
MSRPRIVIDTNVLISAALKPSGLEAQVFVLVAYRAVELCLSAETLAEYGEVLARPKFAGLDAERVSELLDLITEEAVMVTPAQRVAASIDESDNRFLECAVAARADYLVTGNLRHFPKVHGLVKVVNARGLLELLTKKHL